jgi:hypothetical protein
MLTTKENELFDQKAGFKGQSLDEKILAELKKLTALSGKNTFIKQYRIGIELINSTGAAIVDPQYNFTVPKFQYPVSILKGVRSAYVQQTGTGRTLLAHELRLFNYDIASFENLVPTFGMPTHVLTTEYINSQFSIYSFNSNQSNQGYDRGFNILLPERLGGFVQTTTGPYQLPIATKEYIVIDLEIEHSLTTAFKI